MTSDNEDEIRRSFEKKLKRSGYLLESLVEQKLNSSFQVQRDVSYIDKDESKGRKFDFLASTFIPDKEPAEKGKRKAVVNFTLIIECKSLPDHGWIFFPGKDQRICIVDRVSIMRSLPKNDSALRIVPVLTFPKLYHAGGYTEYYLDNDKSDSDKRVNKRESNLFEAIHTVIKATRHQMDVMQKLSPRLRDLETIPVVTVYQPLIIFKGRMYASEIVNGEIELQRIKYAQIHKQYASKFYDENLGFIHIVEFDAIDEYLTILHDHYWSESDYIKNNQEYLLQLTDEG